MASSSSSSPELLAAAAAPSHEYAHVHYSGLSRDEVLEDLSSRFILNLPEEELASVERVCFQVEQAHWYYEDFIREQNPSKFPTYTLKTFSEALFHACPLLAHWAKDHDQKFDSFMKYKTRVPVCGAIMLNETWDKCILVKGWKSSAGWGFPKGKINEQEPTHRCAIREVLEETGYNLEDQLDPENVIQVSIREQSISLYVVPGVPEDFPFETKTRKEISKISWFRLSDLPTWKRNKPVPGKFYLITPFIGALKAFIHDRKPRSFPRKVHKPPVPSIKEQLHSSSEEDNALTNDQSSIGNAQELSSQASSGEPATPSPQYSAARVHSATFESSIGSSTPDPARPSVELETGDMHLANLLSALQRSAASLTLDDIEKPQDMSTEKMPTLPSASLPRSAQGSPAIGSESTARAPQKPSVRKDRLSQARSPPAPSPRPHELAPRPPSVSSTAQSPTSSTGAAPVSTGHGRRGSAAPADISPYLAQTRNITKEMRYISILESVAQESDRTTSRMGHRPSMGVGPPHALAPLPPPSVPPPGAAYDQTVIYSSSPASSPLLPRPNARYPMYHTPAPEPSMGRPRTSHTYHNALYASAVPRQSMNERQLRSMLPLTGQWTGAIAPAPPPYPMPLQAPVSPIRAAPPPQYSTPHIAHNNVVRAANNAQLLSILNTPNPGYRA
ncbi:Dcp2, box A domain-containing protein [Daedaleopsis nitida]|nr:Dcp2, box A domain-containing protein [Daedaleopsis nitida]